jgi:hypothetical protein
MRLVTLVRRLCLVRLVTLIRVILIAVAIDNAGLSRHGMPQDCFFRLRVIKTDFIMISVHRGPSVSIGCKLLDHPKSSRSLRARRPQGVHGPSRRNA